MVSTVKFSQFADANLNTATNMLVGISSSPGGINVKSPFVNRWTTAGRPASPYNGLLGFNTDLKEYEFWDATILMWVQLSSNTTNLIWNNITGTSATMVVDNGYVTNNVGQVTLTLPALATFGDSLRVAGFGAGGFQIVFNAGQNVVFGNRVATTTTGTIVSTNQYDQLELLCVADNTTFIVLSSLGNLTVT